MTKLALTMPVQYGKNSELTELNFRDHTIAEDYLAFDEKGEESQNIAWIASLTGQPKELILKMSGRDYREAVKIVVALIKADNAEEVEKK